MRTEVHRNTDDNIQRLADLLRDIDVAMLTTVDPDGVLRSRPMVTQRMDFDGELWFFTSNRSGKVHSIRADQHVNLAYASPKDNRFVSIAGRASVVEDRKVAHRYWHPLLKAWFPNGPDDPELALIRVIPESAEYWDSPSSTLVQIVGFAKAALTGERLENAGENKRLDLH